MTEEQQAQLQVDVEDLKAAVGQLREQLELLGQRVGAVETVKPADVQDQQAVIPDDVAAEQQP